MSDNLRVENLTKNFRNRQVVRNVSLNVRGGETTGLLGPNGAGKTTSFYMITGLISPDSGRIFLDDVDISSLPMYRRARLGIGYLPQEASIFKTLSVQDNILSILQVAIQDKKQQYMRLDELMEEFGVTHLRDIAGGMLSGGERRRVEIARALASNPRFILLDEPFAGIDPIAINDIRQLIGQLKDKGIGVLITDHNVRETLSIIDHAVIIHGGSVLMQGTAQEIINHAEVKRYYLGEDFSL